MVNIANKALKLHCKWPWNIPNSSWFKNPYCILPLQERGIIQEENILCHLWWYIQTHVSTKLDDRIGQHRRHISCDSTFSSNDQPFQLFTFVIFDHHCNWWITTRNKEINGSMDGCPLDHMTSISKTWIPSSFISYSMIVKLKSIKLGLCISNVHNYVCLRTSVVKSLVWV